MRAKNLAVALLLTVVAAAAGVTSGASAQTVKWLTIYSPHTHFGLQPGSLMYFNTGVGIDSPGLPGGRIACQENITASDVINSQKVDRVAMTGATDPFCGEEMKIKSLPNVRFSINGTASLAGDFKLALPELGCVYAVKHLHMRPFGPDFEGSMEGGTATRVLNDSNPETCPATATVDFTIYGVYEDEEQQFPLAWTIGEA